MGASSPLVSNLRDQMARDEQRQLMLDCVNGEHDTLKQAIEQFHQQERRDEQSCVATLQQILTSIDKILETGDWQSSLFLRNTAKPLNELKQKTLDILAQYQGSANQAVLEKPAVAADKQVVYISLFQSDGHNLRLWELQLRGLARYVLGRPVYASENDVAQMVRAKLAKAQEAYVAVAVAKTAVLMNNDTQRQDREGRALITLKEGVVASDAIVEFVHLEKRYYFKDGKLIQQT